MNQYSSVCECEFHNWTKATAMFLYNSAQSYGCKRTMLTLWEHVFCYKSQTTKANKPNQAHNVNGC